MYSLVVWRNICLLTRVKGKNSLVLHDWPAGDCDSLVMPLLAICMLRGGAGMRTINDLC